MKDADMPLLDRVEAALDRITNRQGLMRIPREATDIDVVVLDCGDEIKRLRAELAQRTAEVAALKAQADPLAEMWAALAEYQEQADKDGHGESWAKMCRERTANAAWDAYHSAPSWNKSSSLWSSRAAADAARAANFGNSAKDAIAQIRRAKEAQP
jgi:hypothetical protein